MRRTSGRFERLLGCLAVAALALGVTVAAAEQPVVPKNTNTSIPAKDASQAVGKLSQKDVMLLTPKAAHDTGKAFVTRQGKGQQMPWQFYKEYADVFYALKARTLEVQPKSKEQADRVGLQAAHYDRLGKLIEEMAEQKRIIDDITFKNSAIPVAQQAETKTKAENQHSEIMREFLAEFRSGLPAAAGARAKTEK